MIGQESQKLLPSRNLQASILDSTQNNVCVSDMKDTNLVTKWTPCWWVCSVASNHDGRHSGYDKMQVPSAIGNIKPKT